MYGRMRKDYVVLPGDQPRPVDPSELPSARRIRHISNPEFFRAVRLDMPELRQAADAVRARRYKDAFEAYDAYLRERTSFPPHPPFEEQVAALEADAERRKGAIKAADHLVAHEVPGRGGQVVKFGKRFKFDYSGPGGIYCGTYMNWMQPLLQAYLLTGEDRYVAAFDEIFNQWIDVRDTVMPKGGNEFNPVWYELAAAKRGQNWPTFYWAYRHSEALRPATRVRMLKATLGNARWLAEHEATLGFRGGNWQMIGAHALVDIGRLCPEFRDAKDWVRVGVDWLIEHARRDFFPDGGHSERLPGYGGLCIRKLRQLVEMGDDVGLSKQRRRWLIDRFRLMHRWYLHTATPPHGTLACGDAGYGDATHFFVNGFQLSGDRELLWPIRDSELARQHKPKEPKFTSTILRPSGFAMMRDGWDADSLYMSINFGPYGSPHTHNDLLNFDIFAHNTLLVADTTRYGGYDCPLEHVVRAATAHNQIVVDDRDFDRLNSRGERVVWSAQDGADFFSARHRGYEDTHHVHLERSVIFVRGEYWFMSDVVREFHAHHVYTWYLHSPWRWTTGKDCVVRTRHKPGLLVVPARADEVRHVRTGCTFDARDTAGFINPPHNERHWIGYQKYTHKDTVVTYGTVLAPYKEKPPKRLEAKALEVTRNAAPVPRGEAEAFEVRRGRKRDVFVFAHKGKGPRRYGGIETDARMALLRFQDGHLRSVNAVSVGSLSVAGRALLAAKRKREEFSWR